MPTSRVDMFIVWRIFQRRTESLSAEFNLETKYYYYPWENKTKLHKAGSYILKTANTLKDLVHFKPSVVFVQLPPTPVLYIVYVYCKLAKCKLVADCHNAMIYSKWFHWPLAKILLRKVDALLVHNEDVEHYASQYGLNAITLRDPLPTLMDTVDVSRCAQYPFTKDSYVIVPWSFAPDEPIDELIQAAQQLPHIKFVMTWFVERLPQRMRDRMPPNLVLTGYLEDRDFNTIFSQAFAAIVLTKREGTQPSGASEAIALHVPLIVSDLKTTRKLYEDMPIYIENTVEGIKSGVTIALEEHGLQKTKIQAFKDNFSRQLEEEIADVARLLDIQNQDKP